MLSKLRQDGTVTNAGCRENLCWRVGQKAPWFRVKHGYAQINCFKKDGLGLQFYHNHKNKTMLIIWYFLDWKFSLEFLETENNKALNTSILPPMYFRDDVFDSLLSTWATYDEESFIPCGLSLISSFFDNLLYRCLWIWRSAAILENFSRVGLRILFLCICSYTHFCQQWAQNTLYSYDCFSYCFLSYTVF